MQFPTMVGVDTDGYIINQTSEEKISLVYKKLLEEIIDILKKCIGEKLHSVYIYGSVGRGEAVLGSSDIDLSVILTGPLTTLETTILKKETSDFIYSNPIIPKVDYDIGPLDDVYRVENLYFWRFWLGHICTCILSTEFFIEYKLTKT